MTTSRLTKDGVVSQRKLKTIVDYIMANLNGSPTVEQMAALAGLGFLWKSNPSLDTPDIQTCQAEIPMAASLCNDGI
jgi:hypothetical protein